jgi:hypothetical protein
MSKGDFQTGSEAGFIPDTGHKLPRLLKRHQLNFFIYGFNNIKLTTQTVFSNIEKK